MRTAACKMYTISAGVLMISAGWAASAAARQLDDKPPQTYAPGQDGKPTTDLDKTIEKNRNLARENGQIYLVPSDWLDDSSVRGLNDEKLGEVKDLVLARVPGRVTFALVGHGGVLTIGEKVTAVPLGAMTWDQDKKCLTLAMSEEQFKASPSLDSGEWMTLGDASRTEPIYSHFHVMDERGADGDKPAGRPDDASKLTPGEHRVLRVSEIRGKALMGSDGREVGKVNDLVLDTSSGRIAFVAVTFGGVLGIGEDKVAVPWTAFDVNKDGHLFVTTIDKDTIKSAPRLTMKDWGELREPGFGARVYKHYGRSAPWLEREATGPGDGKDLSRNVSEYDRLYLSGTARDVNGTIASVDEDVAMNGAPRVVILTVNSKTSDPVRVHVCPQSYLDQQRVQLRKGDLVIIRGREAMVGGKPVLIATQVTPADGKAISLRNADGTCTWKP